MRRSRGGGFLASRTQIVGLHEGKKGRSIDPVFINRLIKSLNPKWIRPFQGSNRLRPVDCGSRKSLIEKMPAELKACLTQGGQTTLMVWADLDHDMECGDDLKRVFWEEAQSQGITQDQFSQIVFIFAKDRLENWIQYLRDGVTDESMEGPRVKHNKAVADAAKKLAERCQKNQAEPPLPLSLAWSCGNWRELVNRMQNSQID